MRFAIASGFACSLSWWLRLMAEGHEVAVWIEPKESRAVGDGLVRKIGSYGALLAWAKAGVLNGIPTVMLFDASGMGDKAEEARTWGVPTVGGGRFMDKLEKDRLFGFEIAQTAGASLPPYEEFTSFDECLAFADSMDDIPVYFKSDRYLDADATHGADSREELVEYLQYVIRAHGGHGRCILQEKIKGVAISTARWWNGRDWVGPFEFTIEHKKFLNGDVGPSTGCCFNAVWFSQEEMPKLAEQLGWQNLSSSFLQKAAPPGLYDINALVTPEGQAYFLEWTPRLGYDSEMTSGRLISNLGDFLGAVALGHTPPAPSDNLAYAVRLGVPPYPWEFSKKDDLKNCLGTYVSGEVGNLWGEEFVAYEVALKETGLEMASPEGIVGLIYVQGDSLEALHERAMKAAKALRAPGLSYRTDGDKVIAEDAKKIKAAGYTVHPGLVE